ncbi:MULTISPECIES: DUF397 domain-containing protein [Streptomyces]|uniref:DUF397 domain-containing protein n=2 Tax=Streptomyces TaxID=1883 RepID=A0ABV9IN20_9ACTN
MAILQGATTQWTKSSYTNGNGACVEVLSPVIETMYVRDSKVPDGCRIALSADLWQSFVTSVRRGTFNRGC